MAESLYAKGWRAFKDNDDEVRAKTERQDTGTGMTAGMYRTKNGTIRRAAGRHDTGSAAYLRRLSPGRRCGMMRFPLIFPTRSTTAAPSVDFYADDTGTERSQARRTGTPELF